MKENIPQVLIDVTVILINPQMIQTEKRGVQKPSADDKKIEYMSGSAKRKIETGLKKRKSKRKSETGLKRKKR